MLRALILILSLVVVGLGGFLLDASGPRSPRRVSRAPAPAPAPAPCTSDPAPAAPPTSPVAAVAAPLSSPSPGPCVLSVRSTPADATVAVQGASVGTAPLAVYGAPCNTPLALAVEKIGYQTWRREVTLSAGEPAHLNAVLTRPQITVRVTSNPSGAAIVINDKPVGKTPLAVDLDAYVKTSVRLLLKGYGPQQKTIVPRFGTPNVLVVDLEPTGRWPARAHAPRPSAPTPRR